MTTIADELLNDFEDSGSENEEEEQNEGYYPGGDLADEETIENGESSTKLDNEGMELDVDDEELEDADLADGAPAHLKMETEEDEEETKARVEKMELKTVSDVRSVAGLMKQLDPVMEVSYPLRPPAAALLSQHLHLLRTAFLTYRSSRRKSSITRHFHQRSRRGISAVSRTIRSTSCSRSRIRCLRASMARSSSYTSLCAITTPCAFLSWRL